MINLRELYGKKYRITLDEAAEDKDDPFMFQIPCFGADLVIYPWTDKLLAIQCDRRPTICKKLTDLGLKLVQDGDTEKTFVFTLQDFKAVAKIVRPRRRRIGTTSHLSAFQFKKTTSESPVPGSAKATGAT